MFWALILKIILDTFHLLFNTFLKLSSFFFLFHGNNITGYTASTLVDTLPYGSDYVCCSTAGFDTITKLRFGTGDLHIFYLLLVLLFAEHLGKGQWHSCYIVYHPFIN